MNIRIIILILTISTLFSCQNQTNTQEETTTPPPVQEPVPAPVSNVLPLLPLEKAQAIINNVDYVDLTMYYSNFSINMNDPKQAKGVSRIILSANLPPTMNCQNAFGHMSFLSNGNLLAEAEVYFQQGCTYLAFQENKQFVYACAIPSDGILYFNDIIKRTTPQPQQ